MIRKSRAGTDWRDLWISYLGLGICFPLGLGILGVIWGDNVGRDTQWIGMRANDVLGMISLGFFLATIGGIIKFFIVLVHLLEEEPPRIRRKKTSARSENLNVGMMFVRPSETISLKIRSCLEHVRKEMPDMGPVAVGKMDTGLALATDYYFIHFPLDQEKTEHAKQIFKRHAAITMGNRAKFNVVASNQASVVAQLLLKGAML